MKWRDFSKTIAYDNRHESQCPILAPKLQENAPIIKTIFRQKAIIFSSDLFHFAVKWLTKGLR